MKGWRMERGRGEGGGRERKREGGEEQERKENERMRGEEGGGRRQRKGRGKEEGGEEGGEREPRRPGCLFSSCPGQSFASPSRKCSLTWGGAEEHSCSCGVLSSQTRIEQCWASALILPGQSPEFLQGYELRAVVRDESAEP